MVTLAKKLLLFEENFKVDFTESEIGSLHTMSVLFGKLEALLLLIDKKDYYLDMEIENSKSDLLIALKENGLLELEILETVLSKIPRGVIDENKIRELLSDTK